MSCNNIPVQNLDFCPGDEVTPGVSETGVFAAKLSEFDTIEKPVDLETATTLEEAATISAAHTFLDTTNGGFHKIQLLPDSGLVETTPVGEKGSLGYENKFTGELRGTSAKVAGYLRKYKNEPMIFIIKEKNGDIKQIGSENSPAYMTPDGSATSGQAGGDKKMTSVVFSCTENYPAPNYEGTITEFTPV